ncbi:MAG: fasciclin domain-containing protein [Actinomycetota bacterium]
MKPRIAITVALAAVALTASACGSSSTDAGAGASSTTSSSSTSAASTPSETPSETAADSAALVGPGCADYAKAVPDGAGSVEGMSKDPVATAASNNPLLKTLVASVSGKLNPKVDLVDTLNNGEFTVFAPVDTAFAKLPAATVKTLMTDDALLSKILTYHVIPGQLDASQIVGSHKTVEGGEVTVSGSGQDLKVDGTSAVICGNVKTANATVYLIDTVLTPKA